MINTKHVFVTMMGIWMGLAGIEHGVGEVLQGNRTPQGLLILSWPDSAFFRSLSGEPAYTILPNLHTTGILAIFFSLLFIGWAVFGAHTRRGGPALMLLSTAMFLFGGGIFPPVFGFFIGVAATGLQAQSNQIPPTGLNRMAGENWRWIFALCCLVWLALFPGIAVLDYFFGIAHIALTLAVMLASFTLLFLFYWSSVQHDRLPRSAHL
jgi:hypothetical protein